MKKPTYKTMKVFDCQWDPGMPAPVKKAFFAIFKGTNNDCYVEYEIASEILSPEDMNTEWGKNKKLLEDWLIANGAEGPADEDSCGETVLIKHWW